MKRKIKSNISSVDCHKAIRGRRRAAPASTCLGSPRQAFLARSPVKRRRVFPVLEYNTRLHDRELEEREAEHGLFGEQQPDDEPDAESTASDATPAGTPAATPAVSPDASPAVATSSAGASPAVASPAAAPAAATQHENESDDDFDPIAAIDSLLAPYIHPRN